MDKRIYWLWLVMVFGSANADIWTKSSKYDTVDEFVFALKENKIKGLSDTVIRKIHETELKDAEKIINKCESENIDVYCYESEGFPQKLKETANPPAILFCRGNLDFLNNNIVVAVAGTRKASDYSLKVTDMLCKRLSSKGCLIVSGLADGIDISANLSVMENNEPTIGVGGSTIDSYFDKDKIYRDIVKNGAIISETCSYMSSRPPKFTDRNRILTGISDALIYVEGSLESRGLDICDNAIMQGKYVFVVPPHDLCDKRYSGQSWLIRRGCKPIFSEQDLIYYLAYSRVECFDYDKIGAPYGSVDDYSFFSDERPKKQEKIKRIVNKKVKSRNDDSAENIVQNKCEEIDYSGLEETEKEICKFLEEKPQHVDSIAASLKLDIAHILTKLTMLEIKGIVISMPGKIFKLKQ